MSMKSMYRGALFVALFVAAPVAFAKDQPAVFGQAYRAVTPAGSGQAKIVYYRSGTPGAIKGAPAAHIYVDGELHTALMPGGFTVFCLTPGTHLLSGFTNDAPRYSGKVSGGANIQIEAGQTYFARVDDKGMSGAPMPMTREQAETELVDDREQVHVLSRASAVQTCDATPAVPTVIGTTTVLNADVTFPFNRGDEGDVTAEGKQVLQKLATSIVNERADRVRVVGHADLIGSDQAAHALGDRRARTVRSLLIRQGVPADIITAESAGNSEPVDAQCGTTKTAANISCNAVNRRVEVSVR